MGRRRRKQARAEREAPPSPDAQGELLGLGADAAGSEDTEEAADFGTEADGLMNGSRRDLVLFEIVEDVVETVAAAERALADRPETIDPDADTTALAASYTPLDEETADGETMSEDAWGKPAAGGWAADELMAEPETTAEPEAAVEPKPEFEPAPERGTRTTAPPALPPPPPRPLFDDNSNFDLALDQLEAARAMSPDDVSVLVNLGWTLGALGRFEDSERELRRAQKLAPDDVAVRAGLGILAFRRGLYQQADVDLRWVCEQDPEHGPAHFYRGEALNRLGRVDQALEALERATQLQPYNHRAFFTMGILFDRKNLREQAAAMYKRSRELQRR